MRNPHISTSRIAGMHARGKVVRAFLQKAQELWPDLRLSALAILQGEEPPEFSTKIIERLRQILVGTLWSRPTERRRTAVADTPIRAEVIEGWQEDPDSATLASWLDHGAPMGYSENIVDNGIFPTANYSSAVEEAEELQKLIGDYTNRGFCHIVDSIEQAEVELGRPPVVNKLGVIVKDKVNDRGEKVRKTRVVWDMRRSGINAICNQSERILLPRLLDLAADVLRHMRGGAEAWLAAIDIKDAFLNVPVAKDRFALTSAIPAPGEEHPSRLVIFNTLVFGAASSPTIWGRFAAWLARTITAVEPNAGVQVYIDDPAFALAGPLHQAADQLTTILLWVAIAGFPVKLSKATGGKTVGATLHIDDELKQVEVSVPEEKVSKLLQATDAFIKKPVVGSRELRSYAGSLSFVAGLVPHLRPFLACIWAVLPFDRAATNDGARSKRHSGRLVHVRRIAPALKWIRALLGGETAPFKRTLQAFFPDLEVTITTDACPFGLGGTLRVSGELVSAFSSDLPGEVLAKFKADRGDSKHTTLWEALALLYACRVWLPAFRGRARVRCKSDSLSLLLMLTKGRAKSSDLSVIAREFALDQAKDRYRLHLLRHIPGITNVEADALSRVFAPFAPELPGSLAEVPRVAVNIGEDFWTVAT
eukprot:s2849_g5.t1